MSGCPLRAVGPKRALARAWNMIIAVLDGDFASARSLVTWMPAHCPASSIGHARDSRGRPIDSTMWRVNRLADVLAKIAAAEHRLPARAMKQVTHASDLFFHHAARLGKVTHDANHFQVCTADEQGRQITRTVRDSTATRPQHRGRKRRRPRDAPAEHSVSLALAAPLDGGRAAARGGLPLARRTLSQQVVAPLPAERARYRKRAADALVWQLRSDVEAEVGVARWISTRQLSPSTGPSAAERLCALRARLSARQADVPTARSAGRLP